MSLPIDIAPLEIARRLLPLHASNDAIGLVEAMAKQAMHVVLERGELQDLHSPMSMLWAVELLLADTASLLLEHHHARCQRLLDAIRKGDEGS